MRPMKPPIDKESFTIRNSPGQLVAFLAGCLFFMMSGGLMLTLPPPRSSLLPWSMASQSVVGVLALLFGAIGLVTLVYVATRPILVLRPESITDCRRKITVPYSDIRSVSDGRDPRDKGRQWIVLSMVDPQKYAALERWSKQPGLMRGDLSFNLDLAKPADYQMALETIREQIVRHEEAP